MDFVQDSPDGSLGEDENAAAGGLLQVGRIALGCRCGSEGAGTQGAAFQDRRIG